MSFRIQRCLITAGPTREYFDPVRFISNPSTGTMGFALAQAAIAEGWSVDLVSGPVSLAEPTEVVFYPVETGEEMFAQVDALFDACDCLIMTAAVCDFRPVQCAELKVRKKDVPLQVEFEPVVDILKSVAQRKREDQIVVGFAAETHDVAAHARSKLLNKNADYIAANQVGVAGSGFGAGGNTLDLYGHGNGEPIRFGPADKTAVARELIRWLAAR